MEFWSSRDLYKALEYSDYRNFEEVIEKAKQACINSHQNIDDHFVDVTEMVELGSIAVRQIKSVFLSRFACYLIIQSADPRKEVVALGHSYFALQTRRQEVEDDRRLKLRTKIKEHNKSLASAAKQARVVQPIDYAIFQNHGYQGLYGGMKKQDIHKHKGLKKSQDILDHMGSEELAAISSDQPKQKPSFTVTELIIKQMPIKHTMKSAKKFVRQLLNLVTKCPKICQLRKKVLRSWSRARKRNYLNDSRYGLRRSS